MDFLQKSRQERASPLLGGEFRLVRLTEEERPTVRKAAVVAMLRLERLLCRSRRGEIQIFPDVASSSEASAVLGLPAGPPDTVSIPSVPSLAQQHQHQQNGSDPNQEHHVGEIHDEVRDVKTWRDHYTGEIVHEEKQPEQEESFEQLQQQQRYVSTGELANLWKKQQQEDLQRAPLNDFPESLGQEAGYLSASSSSVSIEDDILLNVNSGPVDLDESYSSHRAGSILSRPEVDSGDIQPRPETDSGDSQPERERGRHSFTNASALQDSEFHHYEEQNQQTQHVYPAIVLNKIERAIEAIRVSPRCSPNTSFKDSPRASPVQVGQLEADGEELDEMVAAIDQAPRQNHYDNHHIEDADRSLESFDLSRPATFVRSASEPSRKTTSPIRPMKPSRRDSPHVQFGTTSRPAVPATPERNMQQQQQQHAGYAYSPHTHMAPIVPKTGRSQVSSSSSSSPSERRRQRSRSRGRTARSINRRSASPKLNDPPNMVSISSSMSFSPPGSPDRKQYAASQAMFVKAHPSSDEDGIFEPASILKDAKYNTPSSDEDGIFEPDSIVEDTKYNNCSVGSEEDEPSAACDYNTSTDDEARATSDAPSSIDHYNPSTDDEAVAVSDAPSDVETDVKIRYLEACHVFRSALLAKDSSLSQSEKEFLVGFLLDKAQPNPSEEHVAAMESATGALLSDTLFASSRDEDASSSESDTSHEQERGESEASSNNTGPEADQVQQHRELEFTMDTEAKMVYDNLPSALMYDKLPRESILSAGSSTLVNREDADYPFEILGTDGTEPTVMTPALMEGLRGFFPYAVTEQNFLLKFELQRHGSSLQTLLSKVEPCKHTVISVETTDGYVFGSFTSTPWRLQPSWFGSGESFLWRLKKPRIKNLMYNNDSDNEIEIYPYTGQDELIQFCTKQTLAVGGGSDWSKVHGGSPYKGEPTGIGFLIDGDLLGGETNSSVTFDNPRLGDRSGQANEYNIQALECWTVTPCTSVDAAEKLEAQLAFVGTHSHGLA